MDAFESRLASVAKKAIEDEIKKRSEYVLGGSARTYDQHRTDIGYLQGLSASLEILADAKKTLMAGERV